jgi:hypothetical protein
MNDREKFLKNLIIELFKTITVRMRRRTNNIGKFCRRRRAGGDVGVRRQFKRRRPVGGDDVSDGDVALQQNRFRQRRRRRRRRPLWRHRNDQQSML